MRCRACGLAEEDPQRLLRLCPECDQRDVDKISAVPCTRCGRRIGEHVVGYGVPPGECRFNEVIA